MELSTATDHAALGRLVGHFKGRNPLSLRTLYGSVLFVGCSIGAPSVLMEGSTAVPASLRSLLAVGSGLAAVAILVVLARWQRNQSLTVYEGGFVWRRGRREHTVAWSDVATCDAVTEVRRGSTDFRLTIRSRDGETLELTNAIENLERLYGYLKSATGARHG
jgi:hypothetical protein